MHAVKLREMRKTTTAREGHRKYPGSDNISYRVDRAAPRSNSGLELCRYSAAVAGSSAGAGLSFAAKGTSGTCGSLFCEFVGNEEAGAVPWIGRL